MEEWMKWEDLERQQQDEKRYLVWEKWVFRYFTKKFKKGDWIYNSPQFEKWICKLYSAEYKPKRTACLIERAYCVFIKRKYDL